MKRITIDGRSVGPGHPAYIVAEISANHNQDLDNALKLIRTAKEAGADAVKIQTYTPDTMTIDCDSDLFRIKGTIWEGRNLYDLYGEAYTPWQWHPELKAAAEKLKMTLFSTPFDTTAVDYLEQMNVPAYKVASFEVVDIPLLKRIGRTGRPVIVSTGMATLAEIDEAVQTIRGEGGEQIALLKCTSAYPAPPEEMNLRTIVHLSQTFDTPVGLSDHSLGSSVAVAAVALGASIIEKHLILSRDEPGPDSAFSMEPGEFKSMIEAIRIVEKALGEITYSLTGSQKENAVFRRSLFVVRDMEAGELFTGANLRSIRPGHGMHTRYLERVLGRRASKEIQKGTPLDWDLIQC